MRKAKSILLAVSATVGIGALGLVGYGIRHPAIDVSISRDELQRRVDARIPIEGTRLGIAYAVETAKVDLRPDGRVGVEADVRASALNRRADLALAGSGRLLYRDGAFYLTGFTVERAEPRAVDDALAEEDPAPRGRLSEAIGRLGLRDRAATALEAAGVRDGAGFITARKDAVVAAVRERGAAMLADALESHPVYRLKEGDLKQSITKLALQDLRVEDGAIVARLNVMRLAGWVALYIVALLLAALSLVGFGAAFGLGPAIGIGLALGAVG